MTTPNLKHSHSHSYAQHAVSTPLATSTSNPSPTPRSVPSSAVQQQQQQPSSKATTTAQLQNAGSAKAPQGGAAMTASLSQMSNVSTGSQQGLSVMASNLLGASPSNNLLAFASPAALAGLDMATPSLLDAAATGGQPMNLSLSDLGIHSGKRNEDEERRAKLETVLRKLLGQKRRRFGRVSEEGVRRVGRWAGFDVEVEAKWEAKQFEGQRPVAVAGKNNVLIDFSFKDNLPTKIDVSFFSEEQTVSEHQAAAAKVLLADLTPPPGVAAINTKLDRFAANLETLATLDKLSVSGQLNCFEAITGVYEGLKKLYEHEKKAAEAIVGTEAGNSHLRAERYVLCKKSGRPQIHVRRKIGLSLDYWMEKSDVYKTINRKDESAMDVDSPEQQQQDEDDSIFTLEITAEASSPDMYPSLRVSSAWLADRVLKPAEETTDPDDLMSGNQSIDWQDPPQTFLTESNEHGADAMAIDSNNNSTGGGQQKLPSARFVAKLHPPLAMPWTVATQILQSVGAAAGDVDPYRTYEMSLLQKARPTTSGAAAVSATTVTTADGKQISHRNNLFVPKQDFGYVLHEIPFAHPRQIIAMLPVLRQWAAVGALLRGTFLPASSPPAPEVHHENKEPSLADLLAQPPTTTADPADAISIDVSLSTSPTPTLDFVFPKRDTQTGLASVSIGVLSDAQLMVTAQDLVPQNGDQETTDRVVKISRALEVVGDVGVWVEWVRSGR